MEYQLEPLNSPGLVLDLNKSVSSSGIFDFILIRKNSSRGDFDTLLKNLDSSDLLNKQSKLINFPQILYVTLKILKQLFALKK